MVENEGTSETERIFQREIVSARDRACTVRQARVPVLLTNGAPSVDTP